jgi:hypothetical protein
MPVSKRFESLCVCVGCNNSSAGVSEAGHQRSPDRAAPTRYQDALRLQTEPVTHDRKALSPHA